MKMEQKKCKNKKCQRPLPEGYKYKYCENCRNMRIQHLIDRGKIVLGIGAMISGPIITAVTKGKITVKKKK